MSPDTAAEDLKRVRDRLPRAPKPVFWSTPTYVAIERALVLGKGHPVEGNVYMVEPDGRLKPVSGHDLAELHKTYPNFTELWRLGDEESPD